MLVQAPSYSRRGDAKQLSDSLHVLLSFSMPNYALSILFVFSKLPSFLLPSLLKASNPYLKLYFSNFLHFFCEFVLGFVETLKILKFKHLRLLFVDVVTCNRVVGIFIKGVHMPFVVTNFCPYYKVFFPSPQI